MPRDIEEPIVRDDGYESHPAFGRVVMNRVHSTGEVLFDSDVIHTEYVVLRVHGAERKRQLNSDYIHAREQIIEIKMSLSQWASVVSSFGNGGGTSCTISFRQGDGMIPEFPFSSRMRMTMKETLSAADDAYADIKEALDAYIAGGKKVSLLRDLQRTVEQAVGKVEFAGDQLTRYTEKTVQNARADVEAMINTHARSLGIDPAGVTAALAIEGATEETV